MTTDELRSLLESHGRLQTQAASEWRGPFDLPRAVESFYREIGPHDVTIPGYGNPYFLPRLRGLWAFQEGYRWSGVSRKPLDGWDDDWLVVADEGGDPFILSRASGTILLAQHGTGSWDPGELFPDIRSMAACLAMLGTVVVRAGESFTEEESRIRPVHRALAKRQLTEVLGSPTHADAVLGDLGWG